MRSTFPISNILKVARKSKLGKHPVRHNVLQLSCLNCRIHQYSTNTSGCCFANNSRENRFSPRRAVLYVPGNDERKLLKIPTLDVDCAVMDCEDGVAMNRKVEAREMIKSMLDKLEFRRTECCVRVNSVSSGLIEEDLQVIFQAETLPATVMVPKVNSSQDLAAITHSIHLHLKNRELTHKLSLVLFIESAIGLLNIQDICNRATEVSLRSNSYNVDGLVFGSDDFCADIGAKRSVDGTELLYARQKFVLVAKAFRLQAIDMVHIDYKDKEALKEQSIRGANMGFTGKQVIHPSQIPIVQDAFTPGPDQIEWATALIDEFEEHQSTGKGAFTFRGHMIDMPLLLQAQNIVKLSYSIQSAKS